MKFCVATITLLACSNAISTLANKTETIVVRKDAYVKKAKKQPSKKSKKESKNKQKTCGVKSTVAPVSALYTMTNNGDDNSIVVYERDIATGLLKFAQTVSTGGLGGRLGLPDGTPAPVDDPLASTNALIVAGKCLLAVNTGSNSVSSFIISPINGYLTLADQQSSGGEFPVSLAEKDGLVYVLNTGLDGSLSGFNLFQFNCNLSPIVNSFVDLQLATGLSSGELPFFAASPAQIGVDPTGNFAVSLKGFGNDFATGTGGLLRYKIDMDNGTLIETSDQNLAGSTVPFSFDFTAKGTLLLVEAFGNETPGSANAGTIVTVGGDGVEQRLATTQTTTCWIEYSEMTGCMFTTNNGGFSISSAQLQSNGKITLVKTVAAEIGAPLDLILSADEKFLYALASNHNAEGEENGMPAVNVYAVKDCHCNIYEKQTINEGQPLEFTSNGDPTPGYNGIAGIAVWQS